MIVFTLTDIFKLIGFGLMLVQLILLWLGGAFKK